MSFQQSAFLSRDVDDFRRTRFRQYGSTFAIHSELCGVTVALLAEVRAHPDSGRDSLIFSSAARLVTFCQAAQFSAFTGMKPVARANVRSALECLFMLSALVRAKRNLRRVKIKTLCEHRKVLEFCIEHNGGNDGKGNSVLPMLKKIDSSIARFAKNNRRVSIKEMAKLARMTDVYKVRYFLFSADVHADAVSLLMDHSADPTLFKFEPEDDVVLVMLEVFETLAKCCRAVAHHFDRDKSRYAAFEPKMLAHMRALAPTP
jgi:hypothetical protein